MKDYLTSGHMFLLSHPPPDNHYYIPHHGVFKNDNPSSGIRVVFDASAKDSNGLCLNDTQVVGPKLQSDICSVLLHFRSHEFVFTCDVRQMYRQITIADEHRQFQLIRWRFSNTEPVQTYQLNTVTYGVSSSPFLAIRALQQLASEGAESHPLASQALQSCLYVDDLTCGTDTIPEALELQGQLIDLLQQGCFELRKWSANHSALLDHIPAEHSRIQPVAFQGENDTGIKVLGLTWQSSQDTFAFQVKPTSSECTKRGILRQIARIYDPLGFLAPLSLFAKRLIQHLWLLGLNWDDRPPDDVCTQWHQYLSELDSLSSLKIPRFVFAHDLQSCELHAFCDASESGYAAVIYARVTDSNQQISTHLLIAKSKVAPVKRISIPRLELGAVMLLSNLVDFVIQTFTDRTFDRIFAWTDSTVVLNWLHSSPHRFKTFVANRVSHIQEQIPPECWRHVRSPDNPADPASRGLLPNALLACVSWWAGPTWLSTPTEFWPQQKIYHLSPPSETECENKKIVLVSQSENSLIDSLLEGHSSLRKIQGIIAWCQRFAHNSTRLGKVTGPLSASELQKTLLSIVKVVQHQTFSTEIDNLKTGKRCSRPMEKFPPFLDNDGFLRVGGRLSQSSLAYTAKFPILLPSKHRLTELLVHDIHSRFFHPGVNTTLHLLQQNFWLLGGRRTVRAQLAKCNHCFRLNPTPVIPQMGSLPVARVSEAKPFSVTGVDYAGPFIVLPRRARGAKTFKCYLALFVCFATKALHLELASDLSTEAFLASLRRFIALRGRCSMIFSDCGTNFIGANRELQKHAQHAVEAEAIKWQFNPPASPHFGGLWESGVKSVKTHLFRVIGNQILNFEELNALSTDPSDLQALTPGHFLTFEPLTAPADSDLQHLSTHRLSRWQLVQQMQQSFWSRWRNEYLHSLRQRGKWHTSKGVSTIQIGTLVLIKDENAPPLEWRLGRIVQLHVGCDNIPRVATVRTQSGSHKRPLVKLCPLPDQ